MKTLTTKESESMRHWKAFKEALKRVQADQAEIRRLLKGKN